jgi:hypothetical protein
MRILEYMALAELILALAVLIWIATDEFKDYKNKK